MENQILGGIVVWASLILGPFMMMTLFYEFKSFILDVLFYSFQNFIGFVGFFVVLLGLFGSWNGYGPNFYLAVGIELFLFIAAYKMKRGVEEANEDELDGERNESSFLNLGEGKSLFGDVTISFGGTNGNQNEAANAAPPSMPRAAPATAALSHQAAGFSRREWQTDAEGAAIEGLGDELTVLLYLAQSDGEMVPAECDVIVSFILGEWAEPLNPQELRQRLEMRALSAMSQFNSASARLETAGSPCASRFLEAARSLAAADGVRDRGERLVLDRLEKTLRAR